MALLCDCPLDVPCVADILICMFLEQRTQLVAQPSGRSPRSPADQPWHLLATLIRAVVTEAIPPTPGVAFHQDSVATAFRRLYPASGFEGFQFPFH